MEAKQPCSVAVIDDDDDVRDVLSAYLEIAGHTVHAYRSGAEFLEGAAFDQLSCLVVDQRMPGMTGLQLLETLSARGINIPALLMTGASDAELDAAAVKNGFMTVLQKPMSHKDLLNFVAVSQ